MPHHRFRRLSARPLLAAAALALVASPANAIDIQFNYDYDDGFFSDNANRRGVLEAAGSVFEQRLGDSLSAITSSGRNSFNGSPRRPDSGNLVTLQMMDVPADTVIVYAGARQLGRTLGQGGPAGWGASGSLDFFNQIRSRGQEGTFTGPNANEFSLWGGSLTFDNDTNWYFDDDVSNFENIGNQNDFYSVALHELAHVFGFGTSSSWNASINEQGQISGDAVQALVPGGVPVDPEGGHFNFGIESINADGNVQEVLLDPNITVGTRKTMTALDFAALADIGWEVRAVPLPASGLLLLGALGALGLRRRKTGA